MDNQKILAYVGRPGHKDSNFTSIVESQLTIQVDFVTDVRDLCQKLMVPRYDPVMIAFAMDYLYEVADMMPFEVLSLVNNYYKATQRATQPSLAVIVEPTVKNAQIQQLLKTNIKGIIPRACWFGLEENLTGVKTVLEGGTYFSKQVLDACKQKKSRRKSPETLTPRQEQILHLIKTNGASNKVIARSLNISESTVKVHIGAILKKYGVRNRTQLALCSIRGKL